MNNEVLLGNLIQAVSSPLPLSSLHDRHSLQIISFSLTFFLKHQESAPRQDYQVVLFLESNIITSHLQQFNLAMKLSSHLEQRMDELTSLKHYMNEKSQLILSMLFSNRNVPTNTSKKVAYKNHPTD